MAVKPESPKGVEFRSGDSYIAHPQLGGKPPEVILRQEVAFERWFYNYNQDSENKLASEWTKRGWAVLALFDGVLKTVIEAIAAGQRAARSIDKSLGGSGQLPPDDRLSFTRPTDEQLSQVVSRVEEQCIGVDRRCSNFDEVVVGLGREQAVAEAKRCLRCDLEE